MLAEGIIIGMYIPKLDIYIYKKKEGKWQFFEEFFFKKWGEYGKD